jgi:MoaA/NifB/PqqE/SkfB family radical SAM enzyme
MIVLWRVTERCNFACGVCAYDRRLSGARREMDVVTVERFGATLGDYRRQTGDRVLLSWLGGEPLLWRPIFEISQRLRREHGVQLSATTNGSRLHLADTRLGILDAFSELTVSVDGFSEFHDSVRGCPGGWEQMRSGVSALVRERDARGIALKLRVNTVLMRNNIDDLTALCRELATWRVDEITFNPLGGRDRPEFFPDHALRPQDVAKLREMLPALKTELASQGVRLCGADRYIQRIEASAWQRELSISDCAPGEAFLFIDEAGRIAPCSFTSDRYGIPVEEVSDLRELPSRYRSLRAEQPADSCKDCRSNHVFGKFVH